MINKETLLELTESYLKSLISEVANSSEENINSSAPFQELGIDSFHVLKIIKKLEEDFGTLPKTLLFENFNIEDLTHYFVEKHEHVLSEKFADKSTIFTVPASGEEKTVDPPEEPPGITRILSPNKHVPDQTNNSGPILILEKKAYEHPELSALLRKIFDCYKNEGSVSRGTRNIAPNLFIGSKKRGYFNYSRSQNIILVYAYTGPEDYFSEIAQEIYQYCILHNFELNFFSDEPLNAVGDVPFSATPFGVVQRVLNIQDFNLQGKKMRRLRYQVSKFEKVGLGKTEEYQCGSDPEVDKNIASIIDEWCAARTMVNPLIYIVKEEILTGTLDREHRVFLTYLDDVLQNVILISRMSSTYNGYLMDLEFYPPSMPLGGLEFAIVNIIETLVAEGYDMLSMGGTYGCKLDSSPNADPEVDRILDNLRDQDLFNDEGNLQFKNKFRPENRTIFLCRPVQNSNPDNVTDIIMMIADPSKMQSSDEEHHTSYGTLEHISWTDENATGPEVFTGVKQTISGTPDHAIARETVFIEGNNRSSLLSEYGYNPLNIPDEKIEFEAKTDSWSQLVTSFIRKQMKYLHANLQRPVNLNERLQSVFPFDYFLMTSSGRTAEQVFYKAWSEKGIVLQNLLFPTTIFHQIDNGFTPEEIPHAEVFKLQSGALYKGDLHWEKFEKKIEQHHSAISLVCIEVDDNAAGGYPVSLQQLRDVKKLLSKYRIPLVIDGTRIVENAWQIIENEKEQSTNNIWELVREIFSLADAVVASLTKDFCVDKGGIIATNNVDLFTTLQGLVQEEGVGLDVIDKKIIALSLENLHQIESRVLRRMENVGLLWQALQSNGIPVVQPVGGHCVLIDVKQVPEFSNFTCPVASFLAWLYLNTGIRAGAHSVGMQKNTSLNDLVRIAIPVGTQREEIEHMIQQLLLLFQEKVNIPELVVEGHASETIGDIHATYKLKKYHNVSSKLMSGSFDSGPSDAAQAKKDSVAGPRSFDGSAASRATSPVHSNAMSNHDYHPQDIAIIGMAGRYPKAKNLPELWENLKQGRDCIDTIPAERIAQRWKNEYTSKYRGGFIDDVDKFDSLFFNISPREAEILDPQERLFLEVAWEAIEDAGYYPEVLAQDLASRNIGVFVGAVWTMYQILGAEEKLVGNNINPNSFLWSIANRISYWMNFSGPSLTLDTACSSSLTALYLACEAIYQGECSSAIVGGVNLDLHQAKIDINSFGGALSEDGVCRSFGKGANGYVAGEGVGALLLKPLNKAIQDGDNIHGIIKSVVVNHGGKTSGYTVPNPKAQTTLISKALERAHIDARTIGYIEAHGTGTELGDPIEITGLTNSFQEYNVTEKSCAIGSVKSNIGHLEAAAGVVGISKVLLQMKHNQLVPSLHSSELNEHIDFDRSPFYVEQVVEEWNGKEVDGIQYPLRAGVSSFGAGGANAHVILEKYQPGAQPVIGTPQPVDLIFPLSARNEEQLHETAVRLKEFLTHDLALPISLQEEIANIAYTLQVGRKSFDYRVAILAKTKDELVARLSMFINGNKEDHLFSGHIKNAAGITRLLHKKEKAEFIKLLAQQRDPARLAQAWIEGLLSDWQGYQASGASRISLPTYPFADKRHWAADRTEVSSGYSLPFHKGAHPLIDSNESTFERQVFKKTFTDQEFFIYDHLVSDIPTLPGVAYLDLARKAGELATGRKVRRIKNIVWVSPLTVQNSIPTEAYIELKPDGNSIEFEVYSIRDNGSNQLHAQGKLSFASQQDMDADPEFVDLASVKERCVKVIEGTEAYPLFTSLGLQLGPSFQVVQEVFKNKHENEVLGFLKIPEFRSNDFDDFMLHPSLVDGSFQAGMAAQIGEKTGEMFVPYSIGEVEILHPLQQHCFSYLREVSQPGSKVSKADVFILDEEGKVLVKIRDSIGVPLLDVHEKPSHKHEEDGFSTLYYTHEWEKSTLHASADQDHDLGPVLLFDNDDTLYNLYRERFAKAGKDPVNVILVQPGETFQEMATSSFRINPQVPEDYLQLFSSLQKNNIPVCNICFSWPEPGFLPNEKFLRDALGKGVHAFLYLCKALIAQSFKNNIQLLYLYQANEEEPGPHNEAINGFAKTLLIEHAHLFSCKIVEVGQEKSDVAGLLDIVVAELAPATQDEMTVRYQEGERFVRKLEHYTLDEATSSVSPEDLKLKEKGVYLITGGAGGLGLIFAEYLARECRARLVLSGRSPLSEEKEAALDKLRSLGAEVSYMQADVAKLKEVKKLVTACTSQFGAINGIIHSAGVLRDSFIKNKTLGEMQAVFAPKVYGSIHLDAMTKNDNLDFFVMFSSLAAIGGNLGQSDYSFANHFMDSFAAWRERRQARGERSGKTVSFNWSLWADGGMKLDEQTEIFFRKNLGIKPLSIETGIEAFVKGLGASKAHFAVVEGEQDKIEKAWGLREDEPAVTPASAPATTSEVPVTTVTVGQETDEELLLAIQNDLSQAIVEFLKLDAHDLDLDKILLDLGFDSIGLATFANSINKKYQLEITPVLFFEYPSVREIAKYLAVEHRDQTSSVHGSSGATTRIEVASADRPVAATETLTVVDDNIITAKKGWDPDATYQQDAGGKVSRSSFSLENRFIDQPIAVVGMSGVMPQSDDLDEFWEHLKNADNLITVIPEDRWDWEEYDGDPQKEKNKTNSRWGGFMREVDKFDPLFFGISPREAEMMDPQQRIFLETVWKAIEDSGQKVSDLSGTKTGLFVGVATRDYTDLMNALNVELDGYSASGNSHSVLVNRISFLLNLRGPSAPIDTACSSSLVALHRAIESIHTGSSDMAIVGGVQVMLTPAAHISFGMAGMLSDDGKCKTFDKHANGYVRGEGAGAIFLKPLAMAEADGNHIYAVIKSTAENHGGRVTTLTAPNPTAQAELLVEAYEKARLDPATIGYIECHGTGTSLGDPIEIQALKKSFSELYKKHNKSVKEAHCGLSSVKTNIGHLETAAGISGILKVLLSLRHKQIPALVHFEELNPYITLENSPFYIVDKTKSWEPITSEDGTMLPRRAGISSFGFGGANAHIVFEEYVPAVTNPKRQDAEPVLFLLSAKNEERLKAYVRLMLSHLTKYEVDLADLAYTLQVGRDEMTERLALVVEDYDTLQDKCADFLQGKKEIEALFHHNTRDKKRGLHHMVEGAAGKTFLNALIEQKELEKLAELWVSGVAVDWSLLYAAMDRPRRLSLPAYPFAKERYWFSVPETEIAVKKTVKSVKPEKQDSSSRMYYHSVWEETPLLSSSETISSFDHFLIFAQDEEVKNSLKEHLRDQQLTHHHCNVVSIGQSFKESGDNLFEINPENPDDYGLLFSTLLGRDQLPNKVLHLWAEDTLLTDQESLKSGLQKSIFSLFYLSQALMDALKEREKQQETSVVKTAQQRKINVVFLYQSHQQSLQPHYAAISSFAKSIALEKPGFIYKCVEFRKQDPTAKTTTTEIMKSVLPELQDEATRDLDIRYDGDKRFVKKIEALETLSSASSSGSMLKEKGVYIITGGAGGLGLLFAEFLAKQTKARLVLTGRSTLRPEQKKKMKALEAMGAEVVYRKADVSKFEEVKRLIAGVKKQFQGIDGILHSAGVLRDSFIHKKTTEEIEAVLAAKVYGAVNLDQATKDESLDFFVLFSSLTAITGNAGQSDYAYANSFMDNFADMRNQYVTDRKRSGQTLSLQWPLWKEGGMHIDKQMEVFLEQAKGIKTLATKTGFDTFVNGLNSSPGSLLVIEGDKRKVDRTLGIIDEVSTGNTLPGKIADSDALYPMFQNDLLQMVVNILRIKQELFSSDVDMVEYGLDSINVAQLFREISERYALELTPAIFIEYPTLQQLSRYLFEEYPEQLAAHFQNELDANASRNEDPSNLASDETSVASELLVAFQTGGDKPPVFALPGADGNALSLQPLSNVLGKACPFYGVQSVGLDGRSAPLTSIEASARVAIASMKTVQPEGPYTLLGYSNGGVVAYEMARILLEQNEKVSSLLLVDSLCPLERVTNVIEEIVDVSNNVLRSLGADLKLDAAQLEEIPENERCTHLYNIMSTHGFQMSEEQFTTSYHVAITSDTSCRVYQPLKLSQKIDVSLFRAIDGYQDMPDDYGWNQLLLSKVRVHKIHADHFSIIDKDHIHEVAQKIINSI